MIAMRGRVRFDWQQQDSLPAAETPAAEDRPQVTRRRWLMLYGLIALLVGGGLWAGQRLVQRAEDNLAQVEAEMAQAVLEQAGLEQAGLEQARELTQEEAAAAPPALLPGVGGGAVKLLELRDDWALTMLTVLTPTTATDAPWLTEPYQVAQVLREGVDGWAVMPPDARFWDDRRTLDTTFFHVDYGRRDQEAVAAVAPVLDDLLLRLHADLGLPPPHTGDRTTVRLTLLPGMDGDFTDLRYSQATLIVPPPDLIPHPPQASAAHTLRLALAYALATTRHTTAVNHHAVPCDWKAVVEGVGVWLRWEGNDLPDRRRRLAESKLHAWLAAGNVSRLDDLIDVPQDCWTQPPYLDIPWGDDPTPRVELAATLTGYLVAEQGRAVLPALLRHMHTTGEWDALLETALGLSAADVETGWQVYLKETLQPLRLGQ